ncbi:MAG: hypothetical protein KKF36_06500 [Alphaproteobacteria bacterium]|nr:hypothetical protein [Alphaproteobacteria bacterium]
MLKTPVAGEFIDLRRVAQSTGKEERWAIGDRIPDTVSGVIFAPPERPSAMCLAILRGDVLGRSLQTSHYRYSWNGSEIASIYAFDNAGHEINPKELGIEAEAVVA